VPGERKQHTERAQREHVGAGHAMQAQRRARTSVSRDESSSSNSEPPCSKPPLGDTQNERRIAPFQQQLQQQRTPSDASVAHPAASKDTNGSSLNSSCINRAFI
jgi:hypothetical protein